MIDDIIVRLRNLAYCDARAGQPLGKCMHEAADVIDALRRELEQIRTTDDGWKPLFDEIVLLRNEIERLRKNNNDWKNNTLDLGGEINKLRAEIERLRAREKLLFEYLHDALIDLEHLTHIDTTEARAALNKDKPDGND